MEWDSAEKELRRVKVYSTGENELVILRGNSDMFECIGVGTDAAVFRFFNMPHLAFKVFSDDKLEKKDLETEVYSKLGHSEYYPEYYGSGSNFLVISYEEGITLYDCLLKGSHIPKQVIHDVDNARKHASERDLNPRDIHLKNILLHQGRAKIIDVSEYMKPGNDNRWEYLKEGYHEYYPLIDGKAIPLWILETVRKWYNREKAENFNLQNFVKKLVMFFRV